MWTTKMSSSYSTIHLAHPFKMTGQWWDATPVLFWWDVFPGWCFPLRGETSSPLWQVVANILNQTGVGWFNDLFRVSCFCFGFKWISAGIRESQSIVGPLSDPRVEWNISQVCRLQDFVKERQRWKLRVDEKEMLFKVADAVVGGFSPWFLG